MKAGDYKVPSKDANNLIEYDLMNKPELFQYTRRANYDPSKTMTMLSKAEETKNSMSKTTSHWKTNKQMTDES